MYIYVYVCIYIYIYIHIYTYTYICIFIHIYMYIYMYIRKKYVHVHSHSRTFQSPATYKNICIYIYMYICTHSCPHTYIHTHTLEPSSLPRAVATADGSCICCSSSDFVAETEVRSNRVLKSARGGSPRLVCGCGCIRVGKLSILHV